MLGRKSERRDKEGESENQVDVLQWRGSRSDDDVGQMVVALKFVVEIIVCISMYAEFGDTSSVFITL